MTNNHSDVRRSQSRRGGKQAFADQRLAPALLLTPAGLVVGAITIIPLGILVFTSFTDFNRSSLFTGKYNFVGFSQYEQILKSSAFWESFVRTVFFTVALVVGTIVIGVFLSHVMMKISPRLRILLTIVLIFAWAMPNVASSMVWKWMFQPGYGVANWIITKLQIFGDFTQVDWSNNTSLAFVEIWLLVVWQAVPFVAMTVYAAETQISPDFREAAEIDGANEWQTYWRVTFPFLRPTIGLVTILSTIWDFNVFNQIWLVSNGGPNGSTSTLGVYSYVTAFGGKSLIGAGSAIAVTTTIILAFVVALYIRNIVKAGEEL
ncbi:MAG: sugar ABC transporter permease [Arcanobacterium sp.]|nr:sugar ABC transporter permease [Arcanobacterium sp.]MDY5589826.1 sugar ABC transporter permease [Arcanobacterium sp.]